MEASAAASRCSRCATMATLASSTRGYVVPMRVCACASTRGSVTLMAAVSSCSRRATMCSSLAAGNIGNGRLSFFSRFCTIHSCTVEKNGCDEFLKRGVTCQMVGGVVSGVLPGTNAAHLRNATHLFSFLSNDMSFIIISKDINHALCVFWFWTRMYMYEVM